MALLKVCFTDRCSRAGLVMCCAVSVPKHRAAEHLSDSCPLLGSYACAGCCFCCLLGRKEHADQVYISTYNLS
jgi:hypothetical protein